MRGFQGELEPFPLLGGVVITVARLSGAVRGAQGARARGTAGSLVDGIAKCLAIAVSEIQ